MTVANGALSAFARLASGTVLVGALVNLPGGGGGTMGAGYRSTDGAMTFSPWTLEPAAASGRSRRAGGGGQSTLYLAGKNYSDGWALAISTDEGVTVTPVMSYDQVAGIKPCVQQLCLDTCNYRGDAGDLGYGASARAPMVAASDGGTRPAPSSGCHCARAPAAGRPAARLSVGAATRWTRCCWRPPAAGAGETPARRRRPRDRRFPSVLRLDSRGSAV